MPTAAVAVATDAEPAHDSTDATAPHVSRDHHYMPSFLLAGFTLSGRKSDRLWSFDNERVKPEHRTPKAVAFERDYYTVDVPGQPPDIIESYFSRVETVAARILREMLATRAMPTGDDFADLMLFVLLLRGRSPAIREALRRFHEDEAHLRIKIAASSPEAYETVFRNYPADRKKPRFEMLQKVAAEERPFEIANMSGMHAQVAMLGVNDDTLALLHKRAWTLLIANGAVPFVCSDHPVSISDSRSPVSVLVPPGIAYRETDLLFPIHRAAALLGRFEGRAEVHVVGDDVVACVNGRTAGNARRYVFGPEPEFYVLEADGSIGPGSSRWLRPALPRT
jgi:hypothetical protein